MPEPGRLAARFCVVKISPVRISQFATNDFRAIGMFFVSLGEARFNPSPERANSILRIAWTIAFNSAGSRLAR